MILHVEIRHLTCRTPLKTGTKPAATCLHGRSCKSLLNSTGRGKSDLTFCGCRPNWGHLSKELYRTPGDPRSCFSMVFYSIIFYTYIGHFGFPNGHIPHLSPRWHRRAGSHSQEVEVQDTPSLENSHCNGNMVVS